MASKISKLIFFFYIVASFNSPAYPVSGTKNVQIKIIPEYTNFKFESSFYIGVLFKIHPKWHIYWKNPGDSGMSIKTDWSLPDHFILENTLWPVPIKTSLDSILNYAYEETAFLLYKFKTQGSNQNKTSPLQFTAEIRWLECKEVCLPGKAKLTLSIPQNKREQNVTFKKYLMKNQSKYPQENSAIRSTASYENESLKINILGLDFKKLFPQEKRNSSKNKEKIYFFIDEPGIIRHYKKQQVQYTENSITFHLPLDVNYVKEKDMISGYLNIDQDDTQTVYSIHSKVQKNYKPYFTFFIIILLASLWYFYNLVRGNKKIKS